MKLDSRLIADRIIIRNYEIDDKDFCTGMWFDKENGKYLSVKEEISFKKYNMDITYDSYVFEFKIYRAIKF